MQENICYGAGKLNTEKQTSIHTKHVWLEVIVDFNPLSQGEIDKDKLFDELNQDCWKLFDDIFEDMIEWQNNAIHYSFPTD